MLLDGIFDAGYAVPANEIDSACRRLSLEVHEALCVGDHIDTRADWAPGHAGYFVDLHLIAQRFGCDEGPNGCEQGRAVVGAERRILRAELELHSLGRTLAFRTDIDIKPVHAGPSRCPCGNRG